MKKGPNNYIIETGSVWKFPDRGTWATHNGNYRGNWSPHIPRNLIIRYSNEGEYVLDPFIGSGTTLIECKLLNRNGIGIDINDKALEISRKNLNFNCENKAKQSLFKGTATNLKQIKNNSIDLICTHPPYGNIIAYSKNIEKDLSRLDDLEYYEAMKIVGREFYRVLKPKKYCALMIGDIRRNKHVLPMGFNVMNILLNSGFRLKEIIIKEQFNCKMTDYWRNKSKKYNFLLLQHEYIFVVYKE